MALAISVPIGSLSLFLHSRGGSSLLRAGKWLGHWVRVLDVVSEVWYIVS